MLTFQQFLEQDSVLSKIQKDSQTAREHGRKVAKEHGLPAWDDIDDFRPGRRFEAEDTLHKAHPFKSLPQETQEVVLNHTGYDSNAVNQHLFNKSLGKRDGEARYHRDKIKHLDRATTAFSLPHDQDVYSGVNFNPSEHAKNGRLHLPAYTSTSLSNNEAAYHSRPKHNIPGEMPHKHVIRFKLKKGQKGLYLGDHSYNPNERELLLPRNLSVKVHPKPKVYIGSGGLSGEPHKYHVWDAEIED